MKKSNKFSPEVRERAVRLVQEHRGQYPSLWAAVESIAPKIGCRSMRDGDRQILAESRRSGWLSIIEHCRQLGFVSHVWMNHTKSIVDSTQDFAGSGQLA